MTQASIALLSSLSMFLLIPLGIVLMGWWCVKFAYPRVVAGGGGARAVSMRTLVYMAPGIAMLVLLSMPAFYFGHLRSQATYCHELIRVNHIARDQADELGDRCDGLDLDELFADAGDGAAR